ncbi:MAG: energy-coupling factor transporter transmembrane component T [Geobacteraceae bacterium]|nr:energy-coupling factor transporter transmembrane component T [Geobacteraceae bacterium]
MKKPAGKKTGHKLSRTSVYACQYMTRDSLVHQLGAGWKIAFCTLLSALAVGARTPRELLALVAVTLIYYFAARLTPFDLWRDIKFFVYQAVVVISLYCLHSGLSKGLWPGIRTSVQVILFYIPGAVLLRTTSTGDMMRGLRRVVPYRLSFLVFVSIRFVPFFFRELDEISTAQRLRGARLLPRQLLDPRNWGDLFHCLLLPLMVRALKTAEEVSLSAEAREFGRRKQRTYFDVSLCGEPAVRSPDKPQPVTPPLLQPCCNRGQLNRKV